MGSEMCIRDRISADGRHVVHSHGGQQGSGTDQHNWPRHLAVDDAECVFVADRVNRRVTLLSPTLQYVRTIFVSLDPLKGEPRRLYLDKPRQMLYVAVNEFEARRARGHLAAFTV